MLYTEWVQKVLDGTHASENIRTRLVGIHATALRETLGMHLEDVDAIEDALGDLDALGLAQRRPDGGFNLTPLGREAAARSIKEVCRMTILKTGGTLTDAQRSFLQALTQVSQMEYSGFARMRYINVHEVFTTIGLGGHTHEKQEAFLVPLVESRCIDYQEFPSARSARTLYTGIAASTAESEVARAAVSGHGNRQDV